MSKSRILFLLLTLTVTVFLFPKTVAAASQGPVYSSSYEQVPPGSINCSGVSGVVGIGALCDALANGLDSFGNSLNTLGTSVAQIPNSFLETISQKSWEIIFKDIVGPFFNGLGGAMLYGIDPTTYNPQSSSIDQQKIEAKGMLPLNLVGAVFNNPPNLGTTNALAYTVNNNLLGIRDSYAQVDCKQWLNLRGPNAPCPGRLKLSPMYKIWEGIRNIAYLTITLILVIYGFMVIFRSKIDPRTVITAQSVLPRLAIGLIGIAFSYIIASLAVDIGQIGLSSVGRFFGGIRTGAGLNCVLTRSACQPFPFLNSILGMDVLFGGLDFKNPTSNQPIVGGLATLVISFITWYIVFQVFFALITNYAQIYVKTALGPFLIAFGIIPTQSDAIAKWFKGILANALVFPGIYFVINIAIYINNYQAELSMPAPLAGDNIKGFVILGLFVIASKVPAIIEEFLGTQQSGAVSRAGTDISQAAKKVPIVGSFL